MFTKICPTCGTSFCTNKNQTVYCNPSCKTERMIDLICNGCGKSFVRPYKQRNRRKYCSHKCYSMTRGGTEVRVCPNCQKQFVKNLASLDICCSRKCADKQRELPKINWNSKEGINFLKEFLNYDGSTGIITWKKKQLGRKATNKPGDIAGRPRKDKYLDIKIREKRFLAHRIAWLLHYGEWPSKMIDHINGVRTDNRICNLRLATRNQNYHNVMPKNETGFTGIYIKVNKSGVKYMARIKQITIGYYDTIDLAIQARLEKAKELGIYDFMNRMSTSLCVTRQEEASRASDECGRGVVS